MQLVPIFRKSPFARLLSFFAAGILSAYVFSVGQKSFWLMAALVPIMLLVMAIVTRFCRSYSLNWLFGLQAALLLYVTGILSMGIHIISGDRILRHADKLQICLIRIIEPLEVKERNIKTTARIVSLFNGKKWCKENCKVLVYFEKNTMTSKLVPGSEILVKGILKKIPDPGNPGEFNYNKYLANRDIFLQIYLSCNAWIRTHSPDKKSLKIIAYQMRNNLLHVYGKIGLDTKEFNLLSALTLGYRNDLDAHTRYVFSRAGVMHVMALSGFNVGILVLVMNYILRIVEVLNSGRVIKTVVIILVIWLFALITGLSSSVTRATLMFTFVLAGKVLHRQINTYNILFTSAFFLLALSPGMLTDVSFQLSFSAVLGIIMYQPVLYRLFTFKHYLADKIWQLFTVSCAAQFSTFPLTLYYFHQFPTYFWFTNLYVVPLVSLIICIAGAYLLLSFINPLALVLGKALMFSLKGLYSSVEFIESIPYALMDNLFIDTTQAIMLVFIVLFAGLFFLHRKTILLCIALTLTAVFQLENVLHNARYRNQRICMVGALKGITALIFISGRESALIANPRSELTENKLTYAFRNFLIGNGVKDHIGIIKGVDPRMRGEVSIKDLYCRTDWHGKNAIIGFSDQCIVVLSDEQFYNIPATCRLKADLVVVSGNLKPDLGRINELLEMKLLVIDSSVNYYRAKCWKNACEQMGITYWNVSEKGALKLTFNKRKLKR
jgi:competence protein ComEC